MRRQDLCAGSQPWEREVPAFPVRQGHGGWVRFESQQEGPERVVLTATLPRALRHSRTQLSMHLGLSLHGNSLVLNLGKHWVG